MLISWFIRMKIYFVCFVILGVRYVFSGHLHRNAGGFYKDLESVVTSAIGCQLGNNKSGFRIVKVQDEKITHEYYDFDSCPKIVNF